MRPEDHDLHPDSAGWLNEHFYTARPWAYFERRLAHLAVMITRPESIRAALTEGRSIGVLNVDALPRNHDEEIDRDDLRFEAAEGEVLLHHVSETLLRLVHAHEPKASDVPPCPWLELARMRSFDAFKRWVGHVAEADPESKESCRRAATCFGDTGDAATLETLHRYLAHLGEHLLDAGPTTPRSMDLRFTASKAN